VRLVVEIRVLINMDAGLVLEGGFMFTHMHMNNVIVTDTNQNNL